MLHQFKYELLMLIRNRFVWILSGLLATLMLFATLQGTKRVAHQKEAIRAVKAKETEFYTAYKVELDSIERGFKPPVGDRAWYLDPSNPLVLGAIRGAGTYAVMQPQPLAAISAGQSDIFPFFTKVSLGNVSTGNDNENFENPFNMALGQFDLAFVLTFILPLLIIAFSYNILSAEREQGTLRLILSMPLNNTRWLFRKTLLRFVVLLSLSVVLLLFCFLIGGIPVVHTATLHLLGALVLYSMFWFVLAFVVNLRGVASAGNALWLIGLWLLFVLILPGFINILASALHPVPSRVEFVNFSREAENRAARERESVVSDFFQSHPEYTRPQADSPVAPWRKNWADNLAARDFTANQVKNVEREFMERAATQRAFANKFRFLSPAVMFQNTVNELAGTDTESYIRFQKSVQDFEKEWTSYFRKKFFDEETISTADYDHFPRFAEHP